MSTERTGYLDVAPHLNGLLTVREDGGNLKVGTTEALLASGSHTGSLTLSGSGVNGNLTAEGNVTAAKLLTTSTVGTVTTAATTLAEEHGDGLYHITKLTLTSFAMGTSGDNAALAIGAKFYTLPAGAYVIEDAIIVGGVTAAISVTTDTPEVGIGTTVGTGVAATLSTTMEDIIDGGANGLVGGANTAPDVAGGTFAKGMLAASKAGVYIAASGGKARDLYLNAAVTWANVTAAGAVTFTGVITLKWRKIN